MNYIQPRKNSKYLHCFETNLWNFAKTSDPTLKKSLSDPAKLIKNADIDKYKYSRYGIGSDMKGTFSFLLMDLVKI